MDRLCRFWSYSCLFPVILLAQLTLFLCLTERLPYQETMLCEHSETSREKGEDWPTYSHELGGTVSSAPRVRRAADILQAGNQSHWHTYWVRGLADKTYPMWRDKAIWEDFNNTDSLGTHTITMPTDMLLRCFSIKHKCHPADVTLLKGISQGVPKEIRIQSFL